MRRCLVVALALVLSACAAPKAGPATASPSASGRERITLLPGADGKVGKVIVTAGDQQVTLDTAYASADIRGNRLTKTEAELAASRERIQVAINALPERPRKYTVFYLFDQVRLTAESKQDIEAIKHHVATFPAPEVIVTGHADRVGTMAYNDELSLRRAKQVRDLLVTVGIDAERIEIVARGEREPQIPTPDNVSESRNRRVEIKVR